MIESRERQAAALQAELATADRELAACTPKPTK